ncbi:MAG: hypothetical protein QNJ70_15500 [Xenococcaceae cyanobacterium MO_207.B15]|nr:hypothetical protein [Xenococcaceae cyanobacterium MO_207.B15]
MKYYLFCSRGGSGSSAFSRLIKSSGYSINHHSKPDVSFIQRQYMSKSNNISDYSNRQIIGDLGYQEKPDKLAKKTFFSRTNFNLNYNLSINDNLLLYIQHLNKTKKTALFNMAAVMKFFSLNNIPNVVFLIRHPLNTYISWTKPERHYNLVRDYKGGINSQEAIKLFSSLWIGTVKEYLVLKEKKLNPILIRYEYAKQDVEQQAKELNPIFKKWNQSPSIANNSDFYQEDFLKNLVVKYFYEIYQQWNI